MAVIVKYESKSEAYRMYQRLTFYMAHTVLKATGGYAEANRLLPSPGRKTLSLGHAPLLQRLRKYCLLTPQE